MINVTILRHCPRHVLGLSSDVNHSQQEIKEAYRKLVKEHHPDTGGNSERFKEVCNAYEVLSGKTVSNGAVDCSSATGFYDHVHGGTWARSNTAWYGTPSDSDNLDSKKQKHGMHHGASWANQNGSSANYSTRDFYRPYDHCAYGGQSHGFTEEEMNEAKRRTIMHYTWISVKFILVVCCLTYIYNIYCKEDRIQRALKAQTDGYSAEYINKLKMENADKKMQKSYFDRKIEMENEMIKRDLEKNRGKSTVFNQNRDKGVTFAVSYKGKPFTPEGLAAARNNKGILQIDEKGTSYISTSDLSYEMDE